MKIYRDAPRGVDDTAGPTDATDVPEPWYTEARGIAIVAGYAGLLLVGGLLTTGTVLPGIVESPWDATYYEAHPLAIPPQMFLYAFMGALAYVFTKLVVNPTVGVWEVARLALRIPAALIVVFAVYGWFVHVLPALGPELVDNPEFVLSTASSDFPSEPRAIREFAGMAFLVGFLVEHALEGLRSTVNLTALTRVGSEFRGRVGWKGRRSR